MNLKLFYSYAWADKAGAKVKKLTTKYPSRISVCVIFVSYYEPMHPA